MTSNFGYLSRTVPDPIEAPAIRAAVDQLISGRTSLRQVAAQWNALGLRRRQSSDAWDAAAVFQALTSDRFGGVRRSNGEIVDDAPIEWMPLFSREKWDALSVLLRDRTLRSRFSYNRVHLARGLGFCGFCGGEMVHVGSGVRARYVCAARSYLRGEPGDGLRHPQIADHLLRRRDQGQSDQHLDRARHQVAGLQPTSSRRAGEDARRQGG